MRRAASAEGLTSRTVGAEPTEADARAHALKNSVSVILGLAQSIESHVDPRAHTRATQLVQASQYLKDLLTASTTGWPAGKPRCQIIGIDDLMRVVGDRLAPLAESASVVLVIDCGGGAIEGDFHDLAEAMFDLAANAIQASPPRSTVRITTRKTGTGDQEWAVPGVGGGVPEGVMVHQEEAGTPTKVDGMGLGLSLALQVITRHRGVLRIESAEGKRTTVKVWLPRGSAGTS